MATDIRKVYPDMFEETYSSLLRDLDPDRPKEEWRRIFEPGWPSPEEHVGYGLFAGNQMVGFAGLLFAEMDIAGRPERLCNFSSWVAKEEYRRDSISLLLPLRSLGDYTVTNMSATPQVQEIFRRLGFAVLDEYTTVVRPSLRFGRWGEGGRFEVRFESKEIERALGGGLGKIHADHARYGGHMVVESDEGISYCMYTLRRRRRLRTALFHYISNPDLFVRGIRAVRARLLRRHRAVLVEWDSRLLVGREIPGSFRIHRSQLPPPRLFKSESLGKEAVPNLYSELILLNLE